jgi:hypothetical protein
MNLELLKKLEDIKKTRDDLSLKLGEQIKSKKNNYIQSIRNDFADFFKEKGFQINIENLSVSATYGSLVTYLSHETPETDYMGCYFVFKLNLKALSLTEYSIVLSRNTPSISVSVSSVSGSKDADLQKEIEAVQHSIDEIQKRLDNISHEEWKLFIKNDDSAQRIFVSEGFKSMRDLLNSLME